MIIVDSVGWLAFFTGDALAAQYRPYLLQPTGLLCPTIIVYEVCKRMELHAGRQAAAIAAAQLLKTRVIPLDEALATAAARVSLTYHLAMADAIIYTTALTNLAALITSDAHFQGLPAVTYLPHPHIAS
jgi:predicted nucleic acid-binding protein